MTRIDLAESAKSGKVEDAPPVFRAAGGEYCAAVNFDTAELRHVLRGREVEVLSALHIHPPQRGHMRCPRPDHEDVHPSWRWDHDKARWICTCGSGDVFDLVQALQGGGFPETIEFIASVLGLEPRRRPLRRQSPVEAHKTIETGKPPMPFGLPPYRRNGPLCGFTCNTGELSFRLHHPSGLLNFNIGAVRHSRQWYRLFRTRTAWSSPFFGHS